MQPTTHLPEQAMHIYKEQSFSDISTVKQETEWVIESIEQQSYPSHPNYERLINRSFYGFWQI
jgi:hypothetical protein